MGLKPAAPHPRLRRARLRVSPPKCEGSCLRGTPSHFRSPCYWLHARRGRGRARLLSAEFPVFALSSLQVDRAGRQEHLPGSRFQSLALPTLPRVSPWLRQCVFLRAHFCTQGREAHLWGLWLRFNGSNLEIRNQWDTDAGRWEWGEPRVT